MGLLLCFFTVVLMFFYSMDRVDDNYMNIEAKREQIGRSIFYKYDNKIYAAVPSGGYYQVENADTGTFKVVDSSDYYTRCVGVDKCLFWECRDS